MNAKQKWVMVVSKVQARVLREMVKTGLPLKNSRGPILSVRVSTSIESELNYRITTLYALLDRGLIERCDTESTPWYRRDYVLTEEGRGVVDTLDAALAKAEGEQ